MESIYHLTVCLNLSELNNVNFNKKISVILVEKPLNKFNGYPRSI